MPLLIRLYRSFLLRRGLPTLLLPVVLAFSAPPAQAQLGSLYNKVKQKTQKAEDAINNKLNPNSSGAPSGTGGGAAGANTTPAPAANPSSAGNAEPQPASGAQGPAVDVASLAGGPVMYTYCITMLPEGRSGHYYVSQIFEIHARSPAVSVEKYRADYMSTFANPWKLYLQATYHMQRHELGGTDCGDGKPTQDAEQAAKEKQLQSRPMPSYPPHEVTETPWAGTNSGLLTAEQTSGASILQGELGAAIQRERDQFVPSCQRQDVYRQIFDCECYSQKMSAARAAAPNKMVRAAGTMALTPDLTNLTRGTDLHACTSTEKLEAYATTSISRVHYVNGNQDGVKACVPPKFAAFQMAQKDVLQGIDADMQKANSACVQEAFR